MRAAVLLALLVAAAPPAAQPSLPPFRPGGPVAVAKIIDGETLVLADGRILRLGGIETPPRRAAAALAARARAALARLVARTPLTVAYAGAATDRHGRMVAQLFAGGTWVQQALLREGLARVHGAADERVGLTALLAAEAGARAAGRGLWRDPAFAVRDAAAARHDSGSFQIVAGTVAAAARVGGVVYLNFGPDWHTAFTLRIDHVAAKLCRAAGLDLMKLKGARLRVRGFIDGSIRPVMAVSFPEQIELLQAARPGTASGPPGALEPVRGAGAATAGAGD
jgi:endonuclease YncB( thermonuclease family)